MTRIGFIGGGKMAEALIEGLLSSKSFNLKEIVYFDVDAQRVDYISKKYRAKVTSPAEVRNLNDNNKVVSFSDVVILAVKPQVVPEVIKGLSFPREKLLISIAAGITIGFLEKAFPGVPVIRTMPNNPALVGAGVTAVALGSSASEEHRTLAEKIFRSVGEVVMVEEKDMDAVTGLSGSGPAFIYLVIDALAEAGKKLGLKGQAAEKLAIETALGAAKTMKETGKSAKELIDMVSSPGGTTIEGLKVLEKKKVREALAEAVHAASQKSKKLSQ